MTAARKRALLALAVALLGAAAALFASRQEEARAPEARPTLLLLTSLPLLFSDEFTIEHSGSPVATALEQHYAILAIGLTAPDELDKARLLLMAQPRAQRPQDLVALDSWVRRGGRLLLLADPMLEWESERPLGDLLRPPAMFPDTGLLAHWGLRLDAPEDRGPAERRINGDRVALASPGRLFSEGACRIEEGRLVADCRIGAGRAIVVADADFLNGAGAGGEPGPNIRVLIELLARLARS